MLWRGPFGGGAASGASGAIVASRHKGGQNIRARVNTGRLVPTFLQGVIRNAVQFLNQQWKQITQGQRDAWAQYALNVTRINRLGDTVHTSAQNWYIGNNVVLIQTGVGEVDDAPTIFDTGNLDFSTTTLTAGGTSGTLTLSGSLGSFGLAGDDRIALYMSPAFSAGRSKWYGQYRLALVIVGVQTGNEFTFALPFGDGGSTNAFQGQLRVARADGRVSDPFVVTVAP